ncbi:down syndrome cell adhesion molecule-like protein 1, partial [Nephila pilipes]
WYRLRDGPSHGIKRVDTSHQRIMELNGTLLIRKATIQDGGKYICIVNNTNGQERAETELLIRGKKREKNPISEQNYSKRHKFIIKS